MPVASVAPEGFSEITPKIPEYMRLGIEYDAADRFIRTELPSPWDRYDENLSVAEINSVRKNYTADLNWIMRDYGDRLTGYDLAESVKVWLRVNNAEEQSVCEVLRERGWRTSSAGRGSGVGDADVFLSHVQAELPSITLEAMSRIDSRFGVARKGTKRVGSRIWVDFFSLRQWCAARRRSNHARPAARASPPLTQSCHSHAPRPAPANNAARRPSSRSRSSSSSARRARCTCTWTTRRRARATHGAPSASSRRLARSTAARS